MVCLPDGDRNIVAGVLQVDTFSPYLFIICVDKVLRTSTDLIKNGFMLKKQEADDSLQKL